MNRFVSLFVLLCGFFQAGQAQSLSLQELVNRKQFTAVVAHADSLTPADSADFAVMSAIGQAYEGLLKYNRAYTYYKYCFDMDTTNIDMLNALARTAVSLGRVTDAKLYYGKVLASDSTNFYANYQLARLYYQLGDYEQAIDKYHQLMDNDGESSALYRNVADCYTRMEKYPAAAICYFQAYNLNRENAGLASALINTMLRLGDPYVSEALAICDTALYYNPENRLLLQNKAMTLYMNKKYADADTLYANLLAAGDSSYFTLKYGGASRYYAGRYMDAIGPLELAYSKDTTSVEVNLLLGSSLGKTYDRKRAYVLLDKAEEGLAPDPLLATKLLLYRGETLQKDKRYKEAVQLYYRYWKDNPDKLDILFKIATMYVSLDVKDYPGPKERQQGLFILVLYVNKYLESGKDVVGLFFYRKALQSVYEDMFFRNANEETMLSPDGKKSTISIFDIRELINKIPENPDGLL
ncbi:tetratricopeptide repeat protein [Parabacteroides bouchesdurhonensis]|uniref:tetratricopeptide repeat protein n=1 Tax=Parabacteroides bouchesdurhonensis TaxID=1936995 RepID=UPI001F2DA391|nr:tetratricopeptide repeat protein [Parabacteroides bouchesdurhonensis]